MVLPLLMSVGLPALAGSGALAGLGAFGTTLAGMSVPALAGIGAGLGSFIQTGDIGKGIQTGLTSFIGGKALGALTGSTSGAALGTNSAVQGATEVAKPSFIEALTSAGPSVTEVASQGATGLGARLLGEEAAKGTLGQAFAAGSAAFMPAMIGQTMTDAQMMQEEYKNRAAEDDDLKPPMPRPMQVTQSADPFASGGGEGMYFQYQRPPAPPGYVPQYPYYYAGGGILSLAEGGDVDAAMEANGMNEKDVIMEAIEAIKGMSEQPEMALAMFVQKYGEDALRDLVGRVQSGELDDTVARFEEGDKGMVRGPGDGSGVDDMVPATLEGEQDVLLSDGEFVLRKKTTDALEKAYGGGFLDIVNRAEEDAPEKLQQMVG
jgi:hypothetical protein